MKISCTQENLNQGLNIVSHIAGRNSNLPILANILIKVSDKIITLSTTNLEIGITVDIRGKIEKEGEFSVDAKLFSNYIALLPKERIDLELINDELKIECSNQKTKIKIQNATDFPLIPKVDKNNPYLISVKELKNSIPEVVFAAANSEIRPEISGVLMDFIENKLILAATDSYRLTEKKIELLQKNNQDNKIIIPVKTLQELWRILGVFKDDISLEDTDNIEIYLNENQIMFSYNGVDLISRVIEGQYPPYNQIIPQKFQTLIKLNNTELIKIVKTSSLFAKSGIYDIKLDFSDDEKNHLIITSSSSQTGESVAKLEAEIKGENNFIVLNYRYLLEGLQNINSERVVIEANDKNSLCILRPEGIDNYLYLIMPIRQEEENKEE